MPKCTARIIPDSAENSHFPLVRWGRSRAGGASPVWTTKLEFVLKPLGTKGTRVSRCGGFFTEPKSVPGINRAAHSGFADFCLGSRKGEDTLSQLQLVSLDRNGQRAMDGINGNHKFSLFVLKENSFQALQATAADACALSAANEWKCGEQALLLE
jgi:hypothetical protein